MEKCEDTLDNYILETSDLPENEYLAIFMQIIFTLIAYQTAFSFVHNDLHAGNIMYVKTQHKYIYYKYNKHCYRVPTYGKLYKIIDFGRATYKCNAYSFCSDNYDNGEDAYGQYNYEPFMDASKPRIAPHFGFDLCRLGCSIFDYIDKQFSATSRVHKVVSQWCVDDRGLNVLYKSSGEERYPGFKLYKMIVRTVHTSTPVAQLDVPEFAAFRVPNIKQASNVVTVDLDLLSPMYSTTA